MVLRLGIAGGSLDVGEDFDCSKLRGERFKNLVGRSRKLCGEVGQVFFVQSQGTT